MYVQGLERAGRQTGTHLIHGDGGQLRPHRRGAGAALTRRPLPQVRERAFLNVCGRIRGRTDLCRLIEHPMIRRSYWITIQSMSYLLHPPQPGPIILERALSQFQTGRPYGRRAVGQVPVSVAGLCPKLTSPVRSASTASRPTCSCALITSGGATECAWIASGARAACVLGWVCPS